MQLFFNLNYLKFKKYIKVYENYKIRNTAKIKIIVKPIIL